jgi:hypothetical protein
MTIKNIACGALLSALTVVAVGCGQFPSDSIPRAKPQTPDAAVATDVAPPPPPPVVNDAGMCATACTPGIKRCSPSGGLQTCIPDPVTNCPVWSSDVSCGEHATCTPGAGTASCVCKGGPPAGCGTMQSGSYCLGQDVKTCSVDAFGCVFATTTKTCGANSKCTGALPNAKCECNAPVPPTCTAAGPFCKAQNDPAVLTCAKDADGCFYEDLSKAPVSCPPNTGCSGAAGSAGCGCPVDGTALDSGCANKTLNDTECDKDVILLCKTVMIGTQSCKVWTKQTDCRVDQAGLSCAKTAAGGRAACDCAGVTDGKYVVDQTNGSDVRAANKTPTGVAAPNGCQFKTITKATQVARKAGDKITVVRSNANFNNETFPISIAAGVSLSGETGNSQDLKIGFNRNTGAAFSLGDGSTLEGLTLTNNRAGQNAGVGIECTGNRGTIKVRKVDLDGGNDGMQTGLKLGAGAATTCTGTFEDMVIEGFRSGVIVDTGATTDLALNEVNVITADDDDEGLRITLGKVVSAGLVVAPVDIGDNAGIGIVIESRAGAAAASFSGERTSIAGMSKDGILVNQGTLVLTNTSEILDSIGNGVNIPDGNNNTITLIDTLIDQSGENGLSIQNTSRVNVTLDDGTQISKSERSGILYDTADDNGRLTIGSADTGKSDVEISENVLHGIELRRGGSSAVISITNATIDENGGDGLRIDVDDTGTRITVLGDKNGGLNNRNRTIITGNGVAAGAPGVAAGVHILSAPSNAANQPAVVLDGLEVRKNGVLASEAFGIWFEGLNGNIVGRILNAVVTDNLDVGILIEEKGANRTVEEIQRSIVTGNQAKSDTVAGVLFKSGSTLRLFEGNLVADNVGDQLGFRAPQDVNDGNWDVDNNNCGNNNLVNRFFGYPMGKVGVLADPGVGGTAFSVDAGHNFWQNDNPLVNVDFTEANGGTVDTNLDCGKDRDAR